MPYQNDIATLADVVGPAYAAQQAGIQNAAANEEAQANAQVAQNTVAARSLAPSLANLYSQAQTQNELGLAQQNQAAGQVAQGLAPTKIAAGMAQGQSAITAAHVEQMQQLGQVVGGIAEQMQTIPAGIRPAMMGKLLDNFGVTDPSIRQLVANGDPNQLQQISQGLFQASNAARQAMLQENMRGQYAENVAQIGANARVAGAEASANARVQVANLAAQIKQQQQTFEQAAVAAQKRGDMKTAEQFAQLALQARQAQAGITSQILTGQPLQVPNFGEGGSGDGTQQQTPSAPSGPALESAAKAAFGAYEPDKYVYGINPNTGNFGRRPK